MIFNRYIPKKDFNSEKSEKMFLLSFYEKNFL